ncbi:MAG: response regulator transcription factor [Desulfobulbaceae bacterium]
MRILLVEDDQALAGFIARGLKEAGYTVEHVADGLLGRDLALDGGYDAAVVDLMLPGLDGYTLIEEVRQRGVNTPIIILSARRSVDDRVRGLRTGGDDYLTKPFSFSELLARLQALLRRAGGGGETTRLRVGEITMDLLSREVFRGGEQIFLQPREFALLEYLMRNAGHVVSKTMIMEHVWDYNFDPQTNVVEARICRLRDKIDRGRENHHIHTIRGVGYVFRPPE